MKDILKSLKLSEDTISNVLTVIVFVLVGILIFNYFRSVNKVSREQTTSASTEQTTVQKDNMNVNEVVSQGLPAEYTIKKGDSLWKIAQQAYGSGYEWTKVYNQNKSVIRNANVIVEGTKITLPKIQAQKTEHTVIKGDNLWNLAQKTCGSGFVWPMIAADNHISNPRIIEPGMKLTIICR